MKKRKTTSRDIETTTSVQNKKHGGRQAAVKDMGAQAREAAAREAEAKAAKAKEHEAREAYWKAE